ncbi:MAG: hypothetical protein JRH10_19615 [Deltaproteobacteria bacterium]|nr:hypothetical protein [Deltaproteobacteria bacterium]MBW2448183.1 hypothetical protein [Deltaproteobacteria bacterium]
MPQPKGLDDYAGPFDPDFDLALLSRAALARLAREYQMVGHVTDRALMPIIGSRFGPENMNVIAIDEWMGASPVYNERNRRLLGIDGDGVSTIFKGLQLDVGAPHQYMDFRFEVRDESLGWFWLPFCGAYADVKAVAGDDPKPIIGMCHHMEDPTFDATVMAVNPRARCRPVHRPPLAPDHRGPVCRWEVSIDDEHGVLEERDITRAIRATRAAAFEIPPLREAATGGLDDYTGDFVADLAFEDFSQPALVRICREASLDAHLLVRAGHLAIAERWGAAVCGEIARDHFAGAAPVYGDRVRAALGIAGEDVDAVLKTLQVDPGLPDGYLELGAASDGPDRGWVWMDDCDALAGDEPGGWLALLDDPAAGIGRIAAAVNPRIVCRAVDPGTVRAGGVRPRLAFELTLDPDATPVEESVWARVARSTTVGRFAFEERPLT